VSDRDKQIQRTAEALVEKWRQDHVESDEGHDRILLTGFALDEAMQELELAIIAAMRDIEIPF